MNKEEKNFELKKKLLALEKKNIELKHKLKMEELIFERGIHDHYHELAKERGRIKSAEIKKNIERQSDAKFARSYSK